MSTNPEDDDEAGATEPDGTTSQEDDVAADSEDSPTPADGSVDEETDGADDTADQADRTDGSDGQDDEPQDPADTDEQTDEAAAADDTDTDGTEDTDDTDDTGPLMEPEAGLVERLLAFSAEDWLVIVLLMALGVAIVAAVMPLQTMLFGGDQNGEEFQHKYCLEARDAVEGNLSQRIAGEVSCTCLPPTNPDDPTLGDKARNTYTLRCEYPDGRSQDFEIWVPENNESNITEGGTPQASQ